ncbi:MAG: two-component regulator propeller domain-containing protein [Bacteroidota bacterium]|nr:two-component regulator propeller domain-containing protein [Bacteroidota bacterium]
MSGNITYLIEKMGSIKAIKALNQFILTSAFLLFCAVNLFAQQTTISFSNICVWNGMSSNWVISLCRDSDGFMWIGTNRGLNRFDGYNIITFEQDASDSTSLSNNNIASIVEDKDSNLWVGTTFGLNIREHNSQSFRRVSLFKYNAFRCNDINLINAIFVSKSGVVYIGTHEGFFSYKDGQFSHHLVDSTRFAAPVNNIFSFEEDQNGDLWLGTFTQDLIHYNPKSGSVEYIPLPLLFEGKYVNGLQKLFIDSDNLLWIGSQVGLYVYDLDKKAWQTEITQSLYNTIGNKVIMGIQEDQDETIWIATDGAGIYLFNKREKSTVNLHFKGIDSKSISTNGLYCLLIDQNNIVWVGTYKQGLDFHDRSSKKFRLLRNEPETENSLSLNDVDCCMEDSDGNIWIGTNGGGISILDRKTKKFRYKTMSTKGKNGLSSNICVSLFEDHQKNIWIGTYFGGLNKYDPSTGKFTVFKHHVNDTTSISDDRIWSIIEDDSKKLWVATLGGGLNSFDAKTGSFKRYTKENSALPGNYVNYLSIDHKKRLWVCTSDGLSFYNPIKDKFEVFINKKTNTGQTDFGSLVSFFEDSRGWYWLCSNSGLIKFNPDTHTSIRFDKKSGLLSNSINRILEDYQGNLWVSSSSGISKIWFTNIENDSVFVANFTHFDETDGLQGREFSETVSLKTKDGEFLFGGVNGLNLFRPEEIVVDRTIPKLIFTNLRIFNSVITPDQLFNNRVILKKPISHTDQIVLKYSENLFSLEFAALTYIFPGKNKYRYQLEGFDESWFETDGTANYATFTNLNNGDYVLHLKGSNADGTWNEEGISLKIKVLPPFWKSWYAMLGYVFILFAMLLLLRYMILFRERIKVELKMERSEAKQLHELDMHKLKFFTNISHELRTPLTLILSPVEKLLPRFKGLPEEKYLQHIYLNSKKLLNMINQLLDFRKIEEQSLSYNPSWGNIVEFITATVSSFNDLSENKNIELRQITDLREFYMMFDQDKLEKILFNLLSNAFKFTPISGVVIVQVGLEEIPGVGNTAKKLTLVIKVKDNGIGIPPESLDKIFTRFYQNENSKRIVENGTGIGLSLIKEYVNLHGGNITVESALNIGTCFNVFLPVQKIINLQNNTLYHHQLHETKFKTEKKYIQPESKHLNKKNRPVLLIVEDNDDLRLYLKENLEEYYEILEAVAGGQALSILEKRMPDLILSDIMMPGMDGIELCKKVKNDKITCHIPFMFLTAKISEQQKLEGLETGADDYIVKPFNFEILKTKIRNQIQLNRNIREVFRTKMLIEPKDISITSLDEKFMAKALDIIEKHMGNVNFSVEEFSRQMGVSRMQLYNKIVSLTGSTPLEFIRIMRLKRAASLLSKSQLNVSEIAYQVGFNDPKYFTIQFKKEFSVLPSRYRTVEDVGYKTEQTNHPVPNFE